MLGNVLVFLLIAAVVVFAVLGFMSFIRRLTDSLSRERWQTRYRVRQAERQISEISRRAQDAILSEALRRVQIRGFGPEQCADVIDITPDQIYEERSGR